MRVLVLRAPVLLNRSLGSICTVQGGAGEGRESTSWEYGVQEVFGHGFLWISRVLSAAT